MAVLDTVRLATQRLGFLQSLRDNGDIVRIHLGTRPAFVLNAPELVRQVLMTDAAEFDKGRFFDKMRPVLGTGILTCSTQAHRRQRSLVQPAFHHERVRGYVDIMATLAGRVADSWQPGRVLRFDHEMHDLALDVVATSLFAADIGRRAVEETQQLFPYISKSVARRTLSPFPWLERLPTPGNRRFAAACDRLWTVIDEVIAAYRRNGTDHGDLLSMLLASQDGDGLSDREIRDEVVTLMGAGTETSSNSLCWLFYELDRHPVVAQRMRAEIDAVVGDRPVRYEDVKGLAYTQQVISETLRLRSPIWFLMRRVTHAVEIGGLLLEPGTEVLFSPTALHRDPNVYADPMRFDPDRWAPGNDLRSVFLPFGMGPRKCVGDVFARTEMVVIAATILRRWRTEVVGGPFEEVCSGSLHLSRLPIVVHSR
ncbi:cytochrome P450 [Lentzea sp. NPDC051838]|uniref:cytochrome P450 n=1 Tax=Lentzea sp. NPDC051838 TaxID=3154849 RepID=UPI00342A7172